MKYTITPTTKFKKDLKRAKKRHLDLNKLEVVIKILADGGTLSEEYSDHDLKGNYVGCRECHIEPDWLLIYEIHADELILVLSRTGTHTDLFD
jgi:mRNA interferase YafQ